VRKIQDNIHALVQSVHYTVGTIGLQSTSALSTFSADFTVTPWQAYPESFSTPWGVFSLEHEVNPRGPRAHVSAITVVESKTGSAKVSSQSQYFFFSNSHLRP
jgi:hypothetical protein